LITSVVMPQMGLEVTEGTVAAIRVEIGQQVKSGDPVIEMETDKAVTDVVAPSDGVVRSIEVEVGDTVALGASLVLLATGADDDDEPAGDEPANPAGAGAPAAAAAPSVARTADGRVRAAPVARRAARQLGVDLEAVSGTGPRGRVTLRDVEAAANGHAQPGPASAPASPRADGQVETMSAVRAAGARRMTRSAQIPQFALERDVDATWLLAEKTALRGGAPEVGVTDMLLQAMGEVLLRHDALAATYVEGDEGGRPGLLRREGADLGLAVATPRGLLVPVVRGVHRRTLAEIAAERLRLVAAARSGRLSLADMSDATMTLSNLARFGVDRFTAMLNPGESAILAVGRVVERVVPRGRGFTVAPMLTCSLTIDHRVADGAAGAAALVALAELLEGQMKWRA
jgi:pyruvate dehydrogenase E2 component (dihydrolipoamide acetyltransferase)